MKKVRRKGYYKRQRVGRRFMNDTWYKFRKTKYKFRGYRIHTLHKAYKKGLIDRISGEYFKGE